MDIESFPQTDNYLLKALFEQQVSRTANSLAAQKNLVDLHRPPTKDDIEHFLATTNDPDVIERLEKLADYESNIVELNTWLEEYAKSVLHSPANNDERQAARTKFNSLKKRLLESLESLAHVAANEGVPEVVTWVESFKSQIPKLNTTSNDHDLKDMRKWLQDNHPEAGIKTRGKIPLEWKRVYYGRTD